jgi:hypothetical protein
MKRNAKKAKSRKEVLKLSTKVKAGAYVGVGLSLGGGRS